MQRDDNVAVHVWFSTGSRNKSKYHLKSKHCSGKNSVKRGVQYTSKDFVVPNFQNEPQAILNFRTKNWLLAIEEGTIKDKVMKGP
jgi:hypothetical protein